MAKFNYILNDLALINLVTRNLYSKNVCREDKEELENQIKLIMQENKQLKDNWNKLKEFLEDWKENEKYCYLASSPIDRCRKDIYGEILDKMQELEQGSDSND